MGLARKLRTDSNEGASFGQLQKQECEACLTRQELSQFWEAEVA